VVLLPATPSVVLVMKVAFRIPGKKIVWFYIIIFSFFFLKFTFGQRSDQF
jgi:hypothetical protein